MFYIGILHARNRGIPYEITIFTRITISAKTAIFTKTAIPVISIEIIEICYFGGETHHAGAEDVCNY